MGAWFQVQQELVEHPKIIKLQEKLACPQLEAVGLVIALFTRGVDRADRQGKFICDTKQSLGRYLAFVDYGTSLTCNTIVDALIETGWIDEQEDSLKIHDWDVWQSALYTAKERRERDKNRKREERAEKSEENEDTRDQEEGFIPPDQTGRPPSPEPQTPKYSPEFETFWKAYPRSVDKGMAYKKYQARRKDGYSAEELLTAAQAYASECKRKKTEKEYIKHPKTFLGDAMPFVEYIPKQPAQPALKTGENPFRRGMIGSG